jgi:ketosteroid isomerase-like protein
MSASELARVIEQSHDALEMITRGDAEPLKALFSRRADVALANPFGPPVRGWEQVAATMERAATNYRDGEVVGFERVTEFETADLACIVELERFRAKVGGADSLAPIALRVTTILRREEDGWRIVHRHADPITAPRPPASVVQQ